MAKIKLFPQEVDAVATEDDSLLGVAKIAGVTEVECCGMNPLCGKCKVSILQGEDSVTPMRSKEFDYAKEHGFLAFQRLGCLARIQKDGKTELWIELENYIQPKGVGKWHKENLES